MKNWATKKHLLIGKKFKAESHSVKLSNKIKIINNINDLIDAKTLTALQIFKKFKKEII